MRRFFPVGDLTFTVATDADDTNVLAAAGLYNHCDYLVFYTSEDAFTNAITLLVSWDGTNYVTLQLPTEAAGGVPGDFHITAVDAFIVPYGGWTHMRAHSSGAEADDATISVYGVEHYT